MIDHNNEEKPTEKPSKKSAKLKEWQQSQVEAYRVYLRTSAVGLEFGLAIGVGAVLGYLCDRYFHSAPYGLIIGILIGSVAAGKRMYTFVKKYLENNRDDNDDNKQ